VKDKGVKCDTCTFKFLDGVRCVIDPASCGSYKPKSPPDKSCETCLNYKNHSCRHVITCFAPLWLDYKPKPDKVHNTVTYLPSLKPIPDKVHNTVYYLPSQFNPVPDKVLGDTVLTKGQIANSLQVSIAGVLNMDLKLAKDADTHTRSEVGRFLENNNVISLMPGQKSNLGLMLTAEVYQRLIKELEGE